MKEQFIPYELALKLKELGFDEECFGFYDLGKLYLSGVTKQNFHEVTQVLAPLWQQAFDWFREKHGKHVVIYQIEFHDLSIMWDWDIIVGKDEDDEEFNIPYSKTYQEARKACLEKLIEITGDENK